MADHKLTIISNGGKVEYEFRTTGEITPVNVDDHDVVEEKRASGHVNGGQDVYEYNGACMNFAISDDSDFSALTLKRDGKPVNPAHLKMHVAVITPTDGSTSYGISSSGKMIRRGKAEEADVRVSNEEFEGAVGEPYEDKFAFKGTLTGFWCNADCELTIDGVTGTVKGTPPSGSW